MNGHEANELLGSNDRLVPGLCFTVSFAIFACFPQASLYFDSLTEIATFFVCAIALVLLVVFLFVNIVFCLWYRLWLKVVWLLVAPAAALVLAGCLTWSLPPSWLYLQQHKSAYLKQIADAEGGKGTHRMSFEVKCWGFVSGATGCVEIIYDRADTYISPDPCADSVKLEPHFYYVNTVQSGCIFQP